MNGHHSPDLGYPAGFGVRWPTTKLLFANLQDLKEAIKNKWKEVTIETVH